MNVAKQQAYCKYLFEHGEDSAADSRIDFFTLMIDSESMAKIYEFKKPEQNKAKSCSWCQNRDTHPMDPPCDKCKWYDRDTIFDLEVVGEGVVKVRKEVDPETYEIRFIPAEDTDIDI